MGILGKIRSTRLGYTIGRGFLENGLLVNNGIYKKAYNKKISGSIKKYESMPLRNIEIGVTNACNSDCIMCPHSKLKKIGTMSMPLYKKILDNCEEIGIKSVTLSFFGEPLLDPTLIEKIKYAKGKKMSVSFFSNASLLTEKWAKDLVDAKLDNINISFDAYNKETYEKIRKGLKFDVVRNNILNLIRIRDRVGKKEPSINLIFVEMNENKHEVKKFHQDWKKKVDNINVLNMRNWAGQIEKKSSSSFHFKSKMERTPCALIWQKMIVDWNGDVVLCCDDWSHSVILGNLEKERIEDVWKGEKLRKIRELHKKREFNKIPICSGCNKKTVWWFSES